MNDIDEAVRESLRAEYLRKARKLRRLNDREVLLEKKLDDLRNELNDLELEVEDLRAAAGIKEYRSV